MKTNVRADVRATPMPDEGSIWAWRHPRARGAEGRCIGRTDLPVDRRKAKRLARRIQQAARRHGLPRVVFTSPLRRCADVGRQLRRWGWRHGIDPALLEMDFGRWDGLAWAQIARGEVDAWCADFCAYAPGGGEALAAMFERVEGWRPEGGAGGLAVVVAHAGWMQVRRWIDSRPGQVPQARDWLAPPRHGERWRLGGRRGVC